MPRISSAGAWTTEVSVAVWGSVPAVDSDVIGASSARSPWAICDERAARWVDPLVGDCSTQLGGRMGSGAGVLPQFGAGGHGTIEPSFMPASAASIFDWRSGTSFAALVKAETPMPSLAALKICLPPFAVFAAIAWMDWETETARCFSALVARHAWEPAYELYWSTSTPIALILAPHAASMTPLPVLPATWKTTSMPAFCLMNWSPKVLPPVWSKKPFVKSLALTHAVLTWISGLTDLAPRA